MAVRKFPIDTVVNFSKVAGRDFDGTTAGTVVGYYDDFFPIVLLHEQDPNSKDRAKVFHFSVLEAANV